MNYFSKFSYNAFSKTKHLSFALFLIWILIQLTSCANYKEIPYFKNIPSDSAYVYKNGVQIRTTDYEELKIQPNDILNITIQTIDPDLNASILGDAAAKGTAIGKTGNNNDIPGILRHFDRLLPQVT